MSAALFSVAKRPISQQLSKVLIGRTNIMAWRSSGATNDELVNNLKSIIMCLCLGSDLSRAL
jgi:hypothetical protein